MCSQGDRDVIRTLRCTPLQPCLSLSTRQSGHAGEPRFCHFRSPSPLGPKGGPFRHPVSANCHRCQSPPNQPPVLRTAHNISHNHPPSPAVPPLRGWAAHTTTPPPPPLASPGRDLLVGSAVGRLGGFLRPRRQQVIRVHLDPSRVMRGTTGERRTNKLTGKTTKTAPTLPPAAVGSHQSTSASSNPTTQAAPWTHTRPPPNPRHHASEVPSQGRTTCIRPICVGILWICCK